MAQVIIPRRIAGALKKGPIKGHIPVIEMEGVGKNRKARVDVVHWTKARNLPVDMKTGNPEVRIPEFVNGTKTPIPESMIRQMEAGLPPEARFSPRQKFEMLTQRLIKDARIFSHGSYVKWPKSVERELKALGWRTGNPDLHKQVEDLARMYIERAARKQDRQDHKRVARDWNGHLSA